MRKILQLILLTLFAITSLITAQDIDVSGMIRPRLQLSNKSFDSDTKANSFTEFRSQLGVKLSTDDKISIFVQFQDSRIFGSETNTLSNSSNIDLHQGYFKIEKFFKLPIYLKVGRMELAYSNQRLIGSVGWHNVGRSFDGGILGLQTKSVDIDFFTVKTNETMKSNDSLDYNIYSAYASIKGVENYKIHPFIISESRSTDNFNRHTLGVFVAGKHGDFSHEIEAAYQLGTQVKDQDIAAYMFAANLKYTFDSDVKPGFNIGIDYLSGNDTDDNSEYKVFNTLYATNHKFYGFMDYFLNIPNHTYGGGLVDIHVKGWINPVKKLKIALAFHNFTSQQNVRLSSNTTANNFGTEIDLTLGWKYNKKVNFVGGFSTFSPGAIFKAKRGEDASSWAYLMAVVKF